MPIIDIPSCVAGSQRVSDLGDGWFRPFRCTEEQEDHLSSQQAWLLRSRCLAGISVAFMASGGNLVIALRVREQARDYFGIDVEIDDSWRFHREIKGSRPGDQVELVVPLSEGPQAVRIWLPHNVGGEVKLLANGSTDIAPIPANKPTWLLCGDSITQGIDAETPYLTAYRSVAAILGLQVHNQGVGAHHFDADFVDRRVASDCRLITIAYGTNDWSAGPDADWIRDRAGAHLDALKGAYPKARLVVCTPLWRTNEEQATRKTGTLPEVRRIIAEQASKRALPVIDGLRLMPQLDHVTTDGLHPSGLGFQMIAQQLASEIRALAADVFASA